MKTFTVKIAGDGISARDVLEAIWQVQSLDRDEIIVEKVQYEARDTRDVPPAHRKRVQDTKKGGDSTSDGNTKGKRVS